MILFENIIKESNDMYIIKKFINDLENITSNFMIVGGVAVSIYTKGVRKISPDDIDINIEDNEKDIEMKLERLCKKLEIKILSKHNFAGSRWWILRKNSQKIDIHFNKNNFLYAQGNENKKYLKWDNMIVPIIDIESLFALKIDAGREKDILDCVMLLKSNKSLKKKTDKLYKYESDYEDILNMLNYTIDIINQLYPKS
jgi:hypothetical protein